MQCYCRRMLLILLGISVMTLHPRALWAQKEAEHERRENKRDRDAETANVGENTPVITMEGFCDTASVIGKRVKPCKTIVTRSEFEELAEASKADESSAKAQLAAAYVRFSLLAREAQKRGMDKDPEFKKKMELLRNQTLGQMLVWDLQLKSEKISTEEMQKFFRENPAQFEQASLLRIYVPETRYVTQSNRVQEPLPETAPEMKALAEKTYSRARSGEDFATLQKEVFEAANLDEDPTVDLGKMPRSHLRPSHRPVIDMKAGEISQLFHEPNEGYYFYKLVSKESPSFESVKSEVSAALQKHRMDTWMGEIMGSAKTELNEKYFGPAAAKTFGGQ